LLAGQPGNGLPTGDTANIQTGSGNSGCSHRTTFNRFYWIGTSNQNSAAAQATGTFFNYMSANGQEWTNILDSASNLAMSLRPAAEFGICVVDLNENVYSILGNDTWISTNLGVTFKPIVASSYFPIRQDHSGAIYQLPGQSYERITIMAGRGWISLSNPYGTDYNDVWTTTNYGQSWTVVSSMAPWFPRENPNVVVASNGVMVLNGGNMCGGYGCGPAGGLTTGPFAFQGWLSDTWMSLDAGDNWQMLNLYSNSKFAQAAVFVDSQGYMYTIAGQTGPANNTNYAWTNSGYKSSQSLLQVQSWAPLIGLSVPPSFTNAVVTTPSLCNAITPPVFATSSTGRNNQGASSSSGSSTNGGGNASNAGCSSSGSSLSNGAIAGLVIGVAVGVLLLACVLYFLCMTTALSKRAGGGESTTGSKFNQVEESRTDDASQVEMH